MDLKLICSDIDGTLLNSNRELESVTIEEIRRLRNEHNIPFVLISARMPSAMRHLQKDLGFYDDLVCYNGALIYSKNGDELFNQTIPSLITREVFSYVERFDLHLSLFRNDEWFVNKMDYWAKREINNTKVEPEYIQNFDLKVRDMSEKKEGVHKILIMGDASHLDEVEHNLRKDYAQDIQLYRSKDTYIEINVKTASKKHALEVLSNEYLISPKQIMAFGDNYNDIEMLAYVGYGIAVENARDEAKKLAYAITSHHKEHGVAHYLKKVLR